MARTRIYTTGVFGKKRIPRSPDENPRGAKNKPRRKRSGWKPGGSRFGFLEIALIACAVLAVLSVLDTLANRGEIYRGVEVAGIDVGGETPNEARQILSERLMSEAPQQVEISGSDETISLGSEDLGINFNLDSTVERAQEVGRTGGIFQRLLERVKASLGMMEIEAEPEYNTELVSAVIGDFAADVNREPQNATIMLSGTQANVQEGQEGYRIDQEATGNSVRRAVGDLSGDAEIVGGPVDPPLSTEEAEAAAERINTALEAPVTFGSSDQTWELAPEQTTQILAVENTRSGVELGVNPQQLQALLPDMYEGLQTEPKDAGFVFVDGAIEVEDAKPGQQVAEGRLVEDLEANLFDGQHNFEVPLNDGRQPEFTTQEAESMKPTELLGKFRTDYGMVKDPDGNRTYNLNIAADAINNTILAPGEIFSVNDTVSQLDYKEAKVFQEGLIQYAEGGGLCQVASTMYMAATRAGLEIVERHPHYALLEYIRPGYDSTVWFGDIYGNGELDSRFRNNTDSHILLREWVDEDGYMYGEVWGQPNNRSVDLRSEEVDKTNSSSTWVTYKTIEENGEVVEEDRAYKDTYYSLGPNEYNDNPYGFDPVWD